MLVEIPPGRINYFINNCFLCEPEKLEFQILNLLASWKTEWISWRTCGDKEKKVVKESVIRSRILYNQWCTSEWSENCVCAKRKHILRRHRQLKAIDNWLFHNHFVASPHASQKLWLGLFYVSKGFYRHSKELWTNS